jgi:hypothetical protein
MHIEQDLNLSILKNEDIAFKAASQLKLKKKLLTVLFAKLLNKNSNHNNNQIQYIATNDYLMIIEGPKSAQLAWKYFSSQVETEPHNPKVGTVTLRFDRKEFNTALKLQLISVKKNGTVSLFQVNNPVLIAQICRTKIKQNT